MHRAPTRPILYPSSFGKLHYQASTKTHLIDFKFLFRRGDPLGRPMYSNLRQSDIARRVVGG